MIKDIIVKELSNAPFSGEDADVLHVTSLVYCDEQKKQYVNNPYPAIHGKLIHKAIQVIMTRYGYIPEFPVMYHLKNPNLNVYGHVDLYDHNNNVPIEIKTSSTFDIQHAIQLNIYMYMLKARTGTLFYISTKSMHECSITNDYLVCDDINFMGNQMGIELPHVSDYFISDLVKKYKEGMNIGHLGQCKYCKFMGCTKKDIIDIQ
jgi:hypothetical protein